MDLSRLRPIPRVVDSSDGEEDRRPIRLIPRTTCAENHHVARLADTLPCRATSIGATTKRSRSVGIQYAVRSKESVWQPHHPVAGSLRHANRQRPRTRVLGLNDRAKPLSGDGGTRVTPRKKNKGACTVQRRRRSPEEEHMEEQEGEDKIRQRWI
jgi:hypothetical protein